LWQLIAKKKPDRVLFIFHKEKEKSVKKNLNELAFEKFKQGSTIEEALRNFSRVIDFVDKASDCFSVLLENGRINPLIGDIIRAAVKHAVSLGATCELRLKNIANILGLTYRQVVAAASWGKGKNLERLKRPIPEKEETECVLQRFSICWS